MISLTGLFDAIAARPGLVAFTDGQQWLVAWDLDEMAVTSWEQLDECAAAVPAPPLAHEGQAGSWPISGFNGGLAVQLPYEFPAQPGRAWRLDRWARWDGAAWHLHGLTAPPVAAPLPSAQLDGPLRPTQDAAWHAQQVRACLEAIAAGEIYQLNLTLPFTGHLEPGPHRDWAAFRQIIATSPAPWSAFFRGRDGSVASHSPECLLNVRGQFAWSDPIKGTRRRSAGHDAATRADLASSPKDAAELTMIVDLVRNDLGRHALPGSVQVAHRDAVLDLDYVHHRYARVTASLHPGTSPSTALRALFPAGSVTGAPKLRAMHWLRQLEAGPRGAYCGAFGLLSRHDAALAVPIRTAEINGQHLTVHAGGGIVADSDPAAEWAELNAKVAGMARALGQDHPT